MSLWPRHGGGVLLLDDDPKTTVYGYCQDWLKLYACQCRYTRFSSPAEHDLWRVVVSVEDEDAWGNNVGQLKGSIPQLPNPLLPYHGTTTLQKSVPMLHDVLDSPRHGLRTFTLRHREQNPLL